MRAVLRWLHSPDVEDLERWLPSDENFGFLLQAMLGPSDGPGEESLDLTVCTPRWFEANMMDEGRARSGLHIVFMHRYDYNALVAFIERALARAEGSTWNDAMAKLSWLGHWEFADCEEA